MADEAKPQNEGQVSVTNAGGAYTDTGTGAYGGPPAEVTYESPADNESTGAVEGPPAEITYESPAGDEVTASTGAVEGPPAEVTTTQWPAGATTKAVTADEAGVENKALSAMTKGDLQVHADEQGIAGVDQETQTKQQMIDTINAGG